MSPSSNRIRPRSTYRPAPPPRAEGTDVRSTQLVEGLARQPLPQGQQGPVAHRQTRDVGQILGFQLLHLAGQAIQLLLPARPLLAEFNGVATRRRPCPP